MEICDLTAAELGRKIKSGEIGVREAAEAFLDRTDKTDKTVHAYLTIDRKSVEKRADEVQEKIRSGEYDSPLAGVPAAVKDNICTRGLKTTWGTRRGAGLKR